MRALILIAGAALAFAAAPVAARDHPEHRERCDDHDRYENPYSLASIRREREREELAKDIAKAERIERQNERASRARERDDDTDDSDEDDPDDR